MIVRRKSENGILIIHMAASRWNMQMVTLNGGENKGGKKEGYGTFEGADGDRYIG